ncbi:UBP1-associated protein 2C-like [Dendrobium catenatum]|uniref:Heterogeneous nuclear ribonucleoprotein 1 n=1 Tax=Dendrobium catenatum TaxID=906689 RepID=A0A2I0X2E0_9ASPA|nr:UBP1-associated protein 2C-like [Dendrobium catenatum]XP_028549900.1 UBP1-associated protein 2C-like [Dendrobium catenatum]XP_028549901.1 UBP1-associated protein 2C-like [Dendrobium catenatum]PKU82088.1 Heterogeneous nuclear ribonucleoprotein 1 [Dendrobium catenatum]
MENSSKKRKVDENGAALPSLSANLTPEDARKIIESFNQEQLMNIVAEAICRDEATLDFVRQIADRDPVQRKLFIRGLGWETTTEKIRSLFSSYGELAEAVVILDKVTGKSKGYGFITFRHIDGAILALKEPNKKIDGRVTITQLAANGVSGPTAPTPSTSDASLRKIFVGGVPAEMPFDRLRALFSSYGEIEEGPLGFDKQSGKFKGYALFIYKTVEAAQAALVDPVKSIDGNTLQCKLATDGKKGRSGTVIPGAGVPGKPLVGSGGDGHGDGLGMGSQSSMPGSFSSQFGGPGGGLPSYGGFSGSGGFPVVAAGIGQNHHLNSALQSSTGLGNSSLSSLGGQAPPSLGGSGVGSYVGSGLNGGPYGSSLQYPGSGGYGGLGMGSSYNRIPTSSGGMPSIGYPDGGPYSSSSSIYQAQHHQPAGSSPGTRFPPGGGMYHNIPHYF